MQPTFPVMFHTCCFACMLYRDSKKSRQKNGKKNTAHFCENRKNHGSLYSCLFAKTDGFQFQKNILVKIHTTMMSRSHILPVSNKAHGLW